MKPMLFNTGMTRAILEDRKTVTRRVVKPQPSVECRHSGQHEFIRDDFVDGCSFTGFVCRKCGYGVCGPHFKFPIGSSWIRPPYRPGDILYVRETWAAWSRTMGISPMLYYKADGNAPDCIKWRPSIHMPREAARIFLRVKDVRVERLQDITENEAQKEGLRYYDDICRDESWHPTFYDPDSGGAPSTVEGFSRLWETTIKLADRALYGWDANPWVWVIEFERIEKFKEADADE